MSQPTALRFGNKFAYDYAIEILERIKPAVEESCIVGSLRRQTPTCGDIDLVVLPIWDAAEEDLFGGSKPLSSHSQVDAILQKAIKDGFLKQKFSPLTNTTARIATLVAPARGGAPNSINVDFYFADEQNYGAIKMIRTGSVEFNKFVMCLVLPLRKLRQGHGYLHDSKGEIIPCRSEEDYFKAIGMEYIEPWQRNPDDVERMMKRDWLTRANR